jgi:hypothetical protein
VLQIGNTDDYERLWRIDLNTGNVLTVTTSQVFAFDALPSPTDFRVSLVQLVDQAALARAGSMLTVSTSASVPLTIFRPGAEDSDGRRCAPRLRTARTRPSGPCGSR